MKHSANTKSIDLGEERILNVSSRMIDDHNFIGALKMLNKCVEMHGNTVNTHELYAEVFDDMGLTEHSIQHWFRFIDHIQYEGHLIEDADHVSADLSEAYEGLAVGYMNIGNDHFAAYYYNKLLMQNGEVSAEERQQIMESFVKKQPSHLKFSWPPQLVDYDSIISSGVECMRQNDFSGAIAQFEEVLEGSDKYLQARNYIAMCKIIVDQIEDAEAECNDILQKYPDNIQALCTLAAVNTQSGNLERAKELATQLLRIPSIETDDTYKIATVCCEVGMHKEAYDLFCRLEQEMSYDRDILFFKAISAFNCGRDTACMDSFDQLLALDPHAVTARFYRHEAAEKIKNGNREPMSYFYRLPQEERENSLKLLITYSALSDRLARKFDQLLDLSTCIEWALDEGRNVDGELQQLAAVCASKAGFDDYVREILLNPFYSDALKIFILTDVVERNVPDNFGIVISHIYRNINIAPVRVGRAKRKYFVKAYAHDFARFAVLDERYTLRLQVATSTLYAEMTLRGVLEEAEDVQALAAAIYLKSGIREAGINRGNVKLFFGAEPQKVFHILGEEV